MPISCRLNHKFNWIWQGILLGVLGFATNFFKLEMFFQVDFLFGSFFVMLAIQWFGFRAGALAGALAAASTYWIWNHPWAVIIFTMEALVVGAVLARRKRSLLFSVDIIYWFFIGGPLVWIFYRIVMGVQPDAAFLIVLKQSLNGIFNALLLSLAYYFLPIGKIRKQGLLFQHSLFLVFSAFVILPAITATTFMVRYHLSMETKRLVQKTIQWAHMGGEDVSAWTAEQFAKVSTVATAISDSYLSHPQPQNLQQQIENIHSVSPSFVRMGVFNEKAISVAYSPKIDTLGKSNVGIDVSDRGYIAALHKSKDPMVSDVISSKRDLHMPVLAFVSPIISNGNFRGFCSAVFNSSGLANIFRHAGHENGLQQTLLDSTDRVIYSTHSEFATMSLYVRPVGDSFMVLNNGIRHWVPKPELGVSIMQRWRKSLFVEEHLLNSSTGWRLITEVAVLPLVLELTALTMLSLSVLATLLGIVFILSHFFSRGFVRSLCELKDATLQVPERLRLNGVCVLPDGHFEEIHALVINFRAMFASLQAAFLEQSRFMLEEHRHLREKELIIKDLHDGVGGIITNIVMLGEYAVSTQQNNIYKDVLQRIVLLARDGAIEVRSFMNSAFSSDSGWSDLLAEIKDYCAIMLEPHGIETEFVFEISLAASKPGLFQYCNVLRIAREAITNVVKHAEASNLKITFCVTDNSFELIIADNGIGFDSTSIRKRGIANMFSRAQNINAQFSLVAENNGTVVFLRISLNK